MDEDIASFVSITGTQSDRAAQYLQLSDGNLENAIQLYFESPDLAPPAASEPPPVPPPSTRPRAAASRSYAEDDDGVVHIPSDDDEEEDMDMSDAPGTGVTGRAARQPQGDIDADAEMARRLQEEYYGGPGLGGGGGGGVDDMDPEGYRAPIARTTETLVGPDADWGSGPEDMRAAVAEQLRLREYARRSRANRAGIFNQRSDASSIWNSASLAHDEEAHQRALSMATGGASEASAKQNMLAELFRPPFDLMFHGSWDQARDKGKNEEKWLMVNIQDSSVFDCQVLNRDIWKNDGVRDTVQEHFVFIQYNKDDPNAQEYIQYYFPAHESPDAFPHIAIVDPRTGEQVKVWSGRPFPKAPEFLMQIHEFLDRYSLKANARNPVAKRKAEPKKQLDVSRMTEEEMLEMAMQNSLENNADSGLKSDDPDALTKSDILTRDKGKAPADAVDSGVGESPDTPEVDVPGPVGNSVSSPFAQISSANAHQEPPHNPATTTRIQFKHPNGRIVHRFGIDETVRRIYEWLKAEPIEGHEGEQFELVFIGKNLIDSLDLTVQEAGLKMGTVMVEFVQGAEEQE